jgi:hypothetical protein
METFGGEICILLWQARVGREIERDIREKGDRK